MIYRGWKNKQDAFCLSYYEKIKEFRKGDGKFTYNVNYKYPDKYGNMTSSKFKIWQGFPNAFCDERCDYIPEFFIQSNKRLPEFQNCTRYWLDVVYDQLLDVVNSLSILYKNNLLVAFVNTSKYNWPTNSYLYHYKKLKDRLTEKEIEFCDFENLSESAIFKMYSAVIMFDLITDTEDMKRNAGTIAEIFEKTIPVIGYYSFLKEYTQEEIKKHYPKDKQN